MADKRRLFSPCSERDIRAAALKATHERMKAMDQKGVPTIGKFGVILKEEQTKFRAFGEHMAEENTCPVMTWDEMKWARERFGEQQKNPQEG